MTEEEMKSIIKKEVKKEIKKRKEEEEDHKSLIEAMRRCEG